MSRVNLEPAPTGHRQLKKQRTREALVDAARRLYRERGLEGTTIADVAREAGVAPRTFFSYFETKEDVFLGPGDARVERLIDAIRQRPPGEPILHAARRAIQVGKRDGKPPHSAPELAELLRHPAIAARLRERWIRWEDVLAEAIAADVGAGPHAPEPRLVAAALTGAIRVAAAAAEAQPRRAREIAERVFELLASGLGDYGVRPG